MIKTREIIDDMIVDLTMPHVNTFFYKMIKDLVMSGKEKTEILKFFKDTRLSEKVKESLNHTDSVIDEGLEALSLLRFLVTQGIEKEIFTICSYRDKTSIKIN